MAAPSPLQQQSASSFPQLCRRHKRGPICNDDHGDHDDHGDDHVDHDDDHGDDHVDENYCRWHIDHNQYLIFVSNFDEKENEDENFARICKENCEIFCIVCTICTALSALSVLSALSAMSALSESNKIVKFGQNC